MAEVTETPLPGIGVRHDFVTAAGARLGVLAHRSGRRELLVYDRDDPDACSAVVHLDADDTRTLAELLGASQVSEAIASLQQVQGLAIDWVTVDQAPGWAGSSLGELGIRARIGVTIVAVVRGDGTIAAPGPDFVLEPGDVAVVVGTTEGIAALFSLFQQG